MISIVLLALLALSKTDAVQQSILGIRYERNANANCPLACPEGWSTIGKKRSFSENCYKLPSEPAELDTFWNHDKRCKDLDPSAYIMVVDNLAEYASTSGLVNEYSAKWFPTLTNEFMWLGGYSLRNETYGTWIHLDGTDPKTNIVFLSSTVRDLANGTCLAADIKTLGSWTAKSCDEKLGAAICEMPRKPICGNDTGRFLPTIPNFVPPCSTSKLFPNLLLIPYIGALLAEVDDNYVAYVNESFENWVDTSACIDEKPADKPACPMKCPKGSFSISLSPNARCYFLDLNGTTDSYWNSQDKCRKLHPQADIAIANDFMEQSVVMGITKWLKESTSKIRGIEKLWLGGLGRNGTWHFLNIWDGGYLLPMVNAVHVNETVSNDVGRWPEECLLADYDDVSNWRGVPCSSTNAAVICEAPKEPDCSDRPDYVETRVVPRLLTPERVAQIFPNMPRFPGLGEVLGVDKADEVFDPYTALFVSKSQQRYGDAVSYVMCVKDERSVENRGEPINEMATGWFPRFYKHVVPGRWVKVQCKSGSVDAFKIHATTYLTVWSYCWNRGYHVVMPTDSHFGGWRPFLVGNYLGDYYQIIPGNNISKEATKYNKIFMTSLDEC